MKFRICTDGNTFRVKERKFLFWVTWKHEVCSGCWEYNEYRTREDAVIAITNYVQQAPDIKEVWRDC